MGNKFESQGQVLRKLRTAEKTYTLKMLNGCVICMVSRYKILQI